MNVRKVVGRGLMGLGLLLMLIGTASVPSTSWAGTVPAPALCDASCNKCGSSETQADGTFKCFRQVGGVNQAGTCNHGSTYRYCDGCTGDCDTTSLVDGKAACSCLTN